MKDGMQYLDCCKHPKLETVKCFLSTETELVAIRCCRGCGTHWFYRLHEYECITDGYDRNIWYVRLTPEEVNILMKSDAAPPPDRFADHPGFLMNEDGMNRIQGIPYFLE
ncbi:MAG: hypothetical protein JW741_19335 [Sedimentisphaerales bacterium]|nr:hypothetical protein [Sedimentisphaerales bacterium]